MSSPSPAKAPSRWAELRQSLREMWWVYPLIAGVLTVVLGELARPWSELLTIFAIHLLLSLSIGLATTVVYVLGLGTLIVRGGPVRRALVHGASIVAGVLLGTEVAVWLLWSVFPIDVVDVRLGVWRVGGVVTALVMMGSVTYDRLRAQARAVELREQAAQQELLRAQLESLQARINPHFLFNALNTVASLVEEEPEHAIEAIERLSALLRYSLEGAREGRVALRRELEAVRGYLALEGLRFGERLHSEVRVAPGLDEEQVPPFVLQPLVENAVKHGIGSRREGGRVQVTASDDGDELVLVVEDDGPGRSRAPGTRTGHETLRQRLQLLHGAAAGFEAGPGRDGGYRVELRIPRGEAREPLRSREAAREEVLA